MWGPGIFGWKFLIGRWLLVQGVFRVEYPFIRAGGERGVLVRFHLSSVHCTRIGVLVRFHLSGVLHYFLCVAVYVRYLKKKICIGFCVPIAFVEG